MVRYILTITLWLCFILGGYVAYTALNLPNVRSALEDGVEPAQTTQILASDHSLIMSYGRFHYKPLPLDKISPDLIEALLATEDRRFRDHQGVDLIGVGRAMVRNLKNRSIQEGGSTLTQQLARNIFLTNERSFQRKVKEALLAIKLEQQLSKDEILELYLNNVYFGEGAYGVGAASDIYFGKSPGELTLEEAALLAGMPQAPSLYSPFVNYNLAKERRNEVLQNLVEIGELGQEEADTLKKKEIHLNPNGQAIASSNKAPYFNRMVIEQSLEMMGMDEQTFWQKGMKIYTTLDPLAQRAAQEEVSRQSRAYGRTGKNQQAALISINSKGAIIAYVGGKDYSESQFDRVMQAQRQAGSLFKVFVYAAAIEQGMTPLTVYKDEPLQFAELDNWKPENYDHQHHGFMNLAQALARSNNIIAVKLIRDVGPEAVVKMARKLGIQSPLNTNLSLALGSADVTLKEMTAAFSVLANDGVYNRPYAIEKIVDKHGHVLYQYQPSSNRVMQREIRDMMVKMMEGVVRFGTGRGAYFGRPAAGKTGTSDDYRNAWFIGFTPEVTTGVWVGNDDNSVMPGISGGSLPARIWQRYMSRLLARMPKHNFAFATDIPLSEKDFFAYNIEYLSETEKKPTEEELKAMEEQGLTDPNAEGIEPRLDENGEPYSYADGQVPPPSDPGQPYGYPMPPGAQPYGPPPQQPYAGQGYGYPPPNQPYPYPPPNYPYPRGGGQPGYPPQGMYPQQGPPNYPYPPQPYPPKPQQHPPNTSARPVVPPNPVAQ